jgi:hypothetical protein
MMSIPLAAVALALASACALTVKNQRVPGYPLASQANDFNAPADVVVMHYYGSGGWGIKWRGKYLLLAPYFSNHKMDHLLTGWEIEPNRAAIDAGLEGTPVADTTLVLVGHGHVDHVGDVGALLDMHKIGDRRAALVADVSTTNELGPYLPSATNVPDLHPWRFSCVKSLEIADHGNVVDKCVPPEFRVTPIHSAHAPHVKLFGLDVEAFGGRQKTQRKDPPHTGKDFHLGYPWAFIIDLLDEHNQAVFRIHYMDAAAEPPHGVLTGAASDGRDVDVDIACVPGFDYVDEYPDEVLRWGNVRYVMAAHWEDFFRPWSSKLEPVPVVLDEKKLNKFVDRVEHFLGKEGRGVAPLGSPPQPGAAGPRGATWALPVPGETFRFQAGAQPPATSIRDVE